MNLPEFDLKGLGEPTTVHFEGYYDPPTDLDVTFLTAEAEARFFAWLAHTSRREEFQVGVDVVLEGLLASRYPEALTCEWPEEEG